jgi:hypothetical protein
MCLWGIFLNLNYIYKPFFLIFTPTLILPHQGGGKVCKVRVSEENVLVCRIDLGIGEGKVPQVFLSVSAFG